ncbi:MAG: exo-alpha-sialidase [Lentisphaerae bacterium]|jgi:sialidase-1|nr:exo-alpha-sialidase [Lentisphaerota bacterium]MBT4822231.1 exo-alpha-sialidase [Lentisphaerota bacterium]MBT5605061.1 exo-alpha-sialidase [Lentisphaerota bacterium]MBT7058683.1 exo-alpha-sialidase [Lentisphaerota bacterium]MBT7847024.1 exo-alpha-sialidase [Lentisphaerota bacterium]
MTRTVMAVTAGMAVWLSGATGLAEDMAFVSDGQPVDVQHLGPEWKVTKGGVKGAPTNTIGHRLLAGKGLAKGDFTIRARLSLTGLRSSAAAFIIGEKTFFGFAGGHGKVFITGPWFNDARGTPIGEPTDFVTDGKPFDFLCTRTGDELTITIDGKEAYRQKLFHSGPVPCFGFTPVRATMRITSFAATGTPGEYKRPYVFVAKKPILHPRAKALPQLPQGPFTRLGDGAIFTFDRHHALISRDEGATWERHSALFEDPKAFITRAERALIRTREGVLVLLFLNDAEKTYKWDKETNLPLPGMSLPTYALRSEDEGETWSEPIQLYDGWCGAIRDIIQTNTGALVVPGQELLMKEGRHCTRPYASTDLGKTWSYCDILDIGGQGDHAGAIEPTLIQLRDGRIRMLIRSSHGHFYESWSQDDGKTWSKPTPSIKASGAPGILKRLQDGRLVLVWNRPVLDGTTTRQHRTELSVAVSSDEGKTWNKPAVVATNADGNINNGNRVAYPYIFEPTPGTVWITSMQGNLRCEVRIDDLF